MVMEMNQLSFLFHSEDLHMNHKRLLVPLFLLKEHFMRSMNTINSFLSKYMNYFDKAVYLIN